MPLSARIISSEEVGGPNPRWQIVIETRSPSVKSQKIVLEFDTGMSQDQYVQSVNRKLQEYAQEIIEFLEQGGIL